MRPRKPDEELADVKNAHRMRQGGDVLPVQPGAPDPPPWLPTSLVPEFERRAVWLSRLKHCDERDADALATLVIAARDVEQAEAILDREGWYLQTDKGYTYAHPAAGQQERALKRMSTAIRILGVSPTGRGQVHAPPKEEKLDPRAEKLRELRERARNGTG